MARYTEYETVLDENRLVTAEAVRTEECRYEPSCPDNLVKAMNQLYRANKLTEEHIWMIAVEARMENVAIFEIARGGQSSCQCEPRSVFRKAMSVNAMSIIIAHNHPSGTVTVSKEDSLLDKRLREAGDLLGIKVADFIVIGGNDYYSRMEVEHDS